MRLRTALVATAAVGVVATVPPLTDPDDGAGTRDDGTVVIIGPPPPGGGGSVSAVGTGCTTRGATTKLPSQNVIIDVDSGLLDVPEIAAGVTRIVVRNFAADPHGLVVTELESVDDLPIDGQGDVDLDALPSKVFLIEPFPGNTICEGTFEFPAGDYVVFSPAGDDGAASGSSVPASSDPASSAPATSEPLATGPAGADDTTGGTTVVVGDLVVVEITIG